ncbi:MAG: hypothetical protein NTX13_25095 [Acidobacteria bacterium]|nr:hypothetical protein [Acidobacteriota bacterium]
MFPAAEEAGSLRRGAWRYFPVAPGRMEFAVEVRRTILATQPKVVAVELPHACEEFYLRAIDRLPQCSALMYPTPDAFDLGEDSFIYVPVEPCDPFVEAVRTAREIGAEVLFIEPALQDRPHVAAQYPDPYAIRRIGLDKYIEAYRLQPPPRDEELEAHGSGMAWRLQGADPLAETLIVVSFNLLDPLLDAMQIPQEEPARRVKASRVRLVNPDPECLAEITTEMPYLQQRYELWRITGKEEILIDRQRANFDLLREAEAQYHKNTGDTVAHWQRRLLAKYMRNLARTNHDLVAGLFDVTVAARSIVDDNYGWEVWELANKYPAQKIAPDIETMRIQAENVWLNTKKIRLRRRLPRPKQRLMPRGLKQRKKEKEPGEWKHRLDGESICSYPPEDLAIETYGRFLKEKARSLLSEDRMRVQEFSSSLLDGIDLRETLRNWHKGSIYVREANRIAGDAGALCVIFDEDPDDRYSYLATWQGEHQNESDMAFYATNPAAHVVGPGIGRAEYGGFLMTLPARRMSYVWSDPDYAFAESKSETLLLAALDYSVERHVVYVAAKPPRSVFRSIAARLNRSIIYIPIGALSSDKVKRLRVVHILDSYARRKEAKDYIW